MSFDSEQLIDRIYEAAVIPEFWPGVLDALAPLAECDGGFVFIVDAHQNVRIASSERFVPLTSAFVNEGWVPRNIRAPRVAAMNYAGFVVDLDIVSVEETRSDPFYTEFLQVHGAGWGAGTVIPVPNGDLIVFDLERDYSRGPVDRSRLPLLDGLRSHLARAGLLSARLRMERARAQVDALQALGLPGAVLRGPGKVFTANSLFESFVPSLFQDRIQRLVITDVTADGLFAEALSAQPLGAGRAVKSMPIAGTNDRVPMVLHVLPVRGSARDIFTQATVLLVVTPVDRAAVPTAEVLQGLFDLTPAEARVARGVAQAETIAALAAATGVNRETVRSQLKAVLSKTGLSRQQELVNLLAGKALRGQ